MKRTPLAKLHFALVLAAGLALVSFPGRAAEVPAASSAASAPTAGMGPCVDVPAYQGKNAVPLVTSEIYPSSTGDTVVNDQDCPPRAGRQVLIGSWEHGEDYVPQPGENPCAGEPTMKIAYPVDFGAKGCFCWKHWKSRTDLHSNSASGFAWGAGSVKYTQWITDLECGKSTPPPAAGESKTIYTTKCCRDSPPTIWSQVLNAGDRGPR